MIDAARDKSHASDTLRPIPIPTLHLNFRLVPFDLLRPASQPTINPAKERGVCHPKSIPGIDFGCQAPGAVTPLAQPGRPAPSQWGCHTWRLPPQNNTGYTFWVQSARFFSRIDCGLTSWSQQIIWYQTIIQVQCRNRDRS